LNSGFANTGHFTSGFLNDGPGPEFSVSESGLHNFGGFNSGVVVTGTDLSGFFR
jgi:hypothetical protein